MSTDGGDDDEDDVEDAMVAELERDLPDDGGEKRSYTEEDDSELTEEQKQQKKKDKAAKRRKLTRQMHKASGRDRDSLEKKVKELEKQVQRFTEANPNLARLADEVAQKQAALEDALVARARGAVATPAMLQLTKITALAKLRGTFEVADYKLPAERPNDGGADNLGLPPLRPTEQADLLRDMAEAGGDDFDPNEWEEPIYAGDAPSSAGQTPSSSAEVQEVQEVQTARAGVEVRKGLQWRRPLPHMMSFKFEYPLSTTVNVFKGGALFVLNSPNELKAIQALEEVARWIGREADMAHIVASFKVNSYEGQYRSNKQLSQAELARLERVVPGHLSAFAHYEPELVSALILMIHHNGARLMTAKISSGDHGAVIQMMGRKGSTWGLLMDTFEKIYKIVDWPANPGSDTRFQA